MATQTVTVLFTDLVGSTELSSRVGPQATEAWRSVNDTLAEMYLQHAPEMARVAAQMSSALD